MRTSLRAIVCLAVLLGLGSLVAVADEKVPLDKVPPKLMEAVKAKFPKATVVSCEKEDEDGKTQFEFTLKDGDKKFVGIFSPEGKLLATEEPTKEEDVPAAAREAWKKKYPDGKITEIEKVTTGEGTNAKITYEFQFTQGKQKWEAVFEPNGKFVSEEKK